MRAFARPSIDTVRMATMVLVLAQAGARAQDYSLELMAVTGPSQTTIDPYCSINDDGICAFTGRDGANISKAFIASTPGATLPVTFGSATRVFDGASINNLRPPEVATRDRISSTWLVRRWTASGSLLNTIVGQSPTHFDSGLLFVDINDSNTIAFSGLTGGSLFVDLFAGAAAPPISLATYSGTVFVRPQISNDYSGLGGNAARAIHRDNLDRIVITPVVGGAPQVIAGTGAGFTMKGALPGISHDGKYGAFIGDRGNGEGFFVGIPNGAVVQLEPIAGDVHDDGFGDFAETQRAAVLSYGRVGGSPSDEPLLTCIFTATRNGTLGVHAVDAGFEWQAGSLIRSLSAPKAVARVGDVVAGKTIQSVNIYDPINRWGQIAFWAAFSDGSFGIVRATRNVPPLRRLRASCLRVLGPSGSPGPYWTVDNVLGAIAGANALLAAANIQLMVDCIEDVADPSPGTNLSLFTVNRSSLPAIETAATATPASRLQYGWRQDGVNLYFIDGFTDGSFGYCSFPSSGNPCNGGPSNREIIAVAPSRCSPTGPLVPIPAQTIAHEVGHYLNLLHTHELCAGTEAGPTTPPGPSSVWQAPDAAISGDLVVDTPSDPDSVPTLATWYGNASASYTAVIDNLMSRPCDSSPSTSQTTITRGQALRMHTALELFRRHVIEYSTAASQVLGAGRPENVGPANAAHRTSLCVTPPNVTAPNFLSVRGGPPNTVGLLFFGLGPGLVPPLPFGSLSMFVPGPTPLGPFPTDANGDFFASLPPLAGLVGLTMTLQGLLLNDFTHGVQITFGM